jgi:hypothetical protein
MPDLYRQIGILYKVIGQLESASSPRSTILRPAWWSLPSRWICSLYCSWFSLSLSFWLSTGSVGQFLYWQALSAMVCLVEKLTPDQRPAFIQIAGGKITAEYRPVEGAAR